VKTEGELLFWKTMHNFTQKELTPLIKKDTPIICKIMLRDVLEKESLQPDDRWDLQRHLHTAQQVSKMVSKKHMSRIPTTFDSVDIGIAFLG
jgi:hypothetical protein